MANPLTGQVALVTGAGRGIGRGCVLALAEAGARVIAVARSKDDLDEVASAAPDLIETWPEDATGDEILDRIENVAGLSIVINNAGANRPQPFAEVEDEALDYIINLNVRAAFRIARAGVRAMLAQNIRGSIVHMSSQMGHIGAANRTVYCMTKHAIEGLTKAMAVELAPKGIRVNAIAPTFIETPMTKPMLNDPQFKQFVLDMIPMGQIGTVDDVVEAMLYLVSPRARLVTGHSLLVDGGWTAR